MLLWRIVFFPPRGERYSPHDYIGDLSDRGEVGQIIHRLETLSKMEIGDWPRTWVKKITENIWQLTAGTNRALYCLDAGAIVVLYAFRKKGQKTPPEAIARAETHYDRYMSTKKR